MSLPSAGVPQQTERRATFPSWVAAVRRGAGTPALRLLGEPRSSLPSLVDGEGCRLVFDGVLYERDRLAAQLERLPAEPSDADLLLGAYLRFGRGFVQRIKGLFALVVEDTREGAVLAARDPLGMYSLFHAEADGELLFSTSVEALVAQPGVRQDLNRPALADHLAHRWPDLGETYYEAVRRIGPGHLLVADRGGQRMERHWLPAEPGSRRDGPGDAEVVERFEELLNQAVNRGLDLGPAGIYLSGGIDSVTVAALATEYSGRRGLPRPRALSLVFDHPAANEESVQRAVAAELGLEQELFHFDEAVGASGLIRAAMRASAERPAPLLGVWEPAYDRLGSAARDRGCEVILTGSGGDEWLTFSPIYAADLVRSFDVPALWRLWQAWRRSYHLSRREVAGIMLWRFGMARVLGAAAGRALRVAAPGVITRRRRREVDRSTHGWIATDPDLRAELYDRLERSLGRAPHSGGFYAAQARRVLDSPITALEIDEFFTSSRRLGLRLFHPFLDADLARFLYETPPELLIRGGRSKGLVRESLSRRFPELGFERQRKLSGTPFFHEVMVREVPSIYREIGGARALAELGLVDLARLDAHVAGLSPASRLTDTFPLWHALSVEAWIRPRIGLQLAP